jgi:hypothetical protein
LPLKAGKLDPLLELVQDEGMAATLFDHYNVVLELAFNRSTTVDFQGIGVLVAELNDLEVLFLEAEVWGTIKELPNDKAPRPDRFTGRFYKEAWPIIKLDVKNAINAFLVGSERASRPLVISVINDNVDYYD